MRAQAATGISRASVRLRASNMRVKRLPARAQGTASWVVAWQALHWMRGNWQYTWASNWKKSRCRQLRARWSCTACSGAPQAGQAALLDCQAMCRSIRLLLTSSCTRCTAQGGAKPSACENSASCMFASPVGLVCQYNTLRGVWTVVCHPKRKRAVYVKCRTSFSPTARPTISCPPIGRRVAQPRPPCALRGGSHRWPGSDRPDPSIRRSRLQGAPPSHFAGHFGLRLLHRGVLQSQAGNSHL